MADIIENVITSFKQTLDWHLWLYFLAVYFIEGIVDSIVIVVFVLLGALAAFGFLGLVGFENIPQLFSNPQTLAANPGFLGFVAIAMILFALAMLAFVFVSSLFIGVRYNLVNNFIKSKKLDLGKAFEAARLRVFTLFKAFLVLGVIVWVVLLLVMLPLIFSIPNLIASDSAAVAIGVIGLILYLVVIMLVFALAMFLLLPFFALVAPTVLFEKAGAIDSLKRAFAMAKANYFGNLGFVLVYTIILMAIGIVINIIIRVLALIFMVPVMLFSESGGSAAASGAIASVMAVSAISILIFTPYLIWTLVFEAMAFRNLFFINADLKPKNKPKKNP